VSRRQRGPPPAAAPRAPVTRQRPSAGTFCARNKALFTFEESDETGMSEARWHERRQARHGEKGKAAVVVPSAECCLPAHVAIHASVAARM